MGNHDVGCAFAAAADLFWITVDPAKVTKELALVSLEVVGNRYRGADAEFDDYLWNQTTPLGRIVAIAFDAQPDELVSVKNAPEEDFERWYDGPVTRFRQHFDFC